MLQKPLNVIYVCGASIFFDLSLIYLLRLDGGGSLAFWLILNLSICD
jgi:hypothetical protein